MWVTKWHLGQQVGKVVRLFFRAISLFIMISDSSIEMSIRGHPSVQC